MLKRNYKILFLIILFANCLSTNGQSLEQIVKQHEKKNALQVDVPVKYSQCVSLPEFTVQSFDRFSILVKELNLISLEESFESSIHNLPQMVLVILVVLLTLYLLHRQLRNRIAQFFSHSIIFCTASILLYILMAWFLLFYVKTELVDKKRYKQAIAWLTQSEPFHELLSPMMWSENPARELRVFTLKTAIYESVENAPLSAAAYAQLNQDYSTADYRENALLAGARFMLDKGMHSLDSIVNPFFKKAFELAQKANHINDSFVSQLALQTIQGKRAAFYIHHGNYVAASASLNKIKKWDISIYAHSVAFLARQKSAETLIDGGFDLASIQVSIQNIESLIAQIHRTIGKPKYHLSAATIDITCHLVGLKEIAAQMLMQESTILESIDILLQIERLVKNTKTVNTLLPEAYRIYGLSQLANNYPTKAVKSFQLAVAQKPDNLKYRCELAHSLFERGYASALNNDFSGAFNDVRLAESSCLNSENATAWRALINLTHGEYLMRHGAWNKAEKAFRQSISYHAPDLSELAKQYINDIIKAKHRLQQLKRVNYWAKVPGITGSLCIKADNSKECRILLFNGNHPVAEANKNFTEVYFAYPNGTLLLDTDHNGYFDTVRFDNGLNSHVIVDSDNDLRMDSEFWYRDNHLVSSQQHSGKIMLRVPSGAIGTATDVFSAPDAYLRLYHNRIYLGKTNTRVNSSYPSWRYEGFSINFKHKDKIYIQMMDEDLFYDDRIDEFLIQTLPNSGYMVGLNNKAAIELQITPTNLPNGFYESLQSDSVSNSFRHSINIDDKALASVIQKAADEESRAKLASTIGALVAPEAIIVTLLKGVSIPRHIALAIIGHELTYNELKNATEQ